MPFRDGHGKMDNDRVFEMTFTRQFDPHEGFVKWEKGQTKQLIVGTVIKEYGKDVLAHSHKMEVRLGNEIWVKEK